MARTVKKKKELTIEEKLAEALVPVEEQPYQVPENWCWSKFSPLIELISGRDAALSECNDSGIGVPYILGASNIENNSFNIERWIERPQVISKRGDILLSVKGTVGKLYIQQEDSINISRQIMAIRSSSILNKHYVFLFLLSVCDELREVANGLIPGLSRKDILTKSFPLPPLQEQQRIVDRIESLFAKLNEAKEKAQAVVDGFEDRKAAILHKAFTGELTAGWRDEKGTSIDDWKYTSLKECSSAIGDGLHGTPLYDSDGQYYFINGNNFEGEKIVIKEDTKTVNHNEYNKHKKDLSPDATVFVSINGTLGKTAFFNNEPVILGKSACYVNVLPNLSKYYLRWFFESKEFIEYANEKATGSTIKNLGLKAMRNLPLHLPSVFEQIKIVQILDILMQSEQQAKEAAEQVISQIDTIKKSILARAFRGELGTNDPEDESAVELLKRIL